MDDHDAESWEQEYHRTERERIRRKDERLRVVGRFVKRTLIGATGLSALGGGILGLVVLAGKCNVNQERSKRIREEVELFYDEQRIACITEHGREQCNIWFEIGMHQCDTSSSSLCIQERKASRAAKFGMEW